MTDAYICDYVRTPIGRFGGALAQVRADDLGAVPLKALMERNRSADWEAVDDLIYGCANQAGEDNRNVARMSLLLAGLPEAVPGTTINRLCGSGMDALINAARAIRAGEAELMVAGGVESMRTLSRLSARERRRGSGSLLDTSCSSFCAFARRRIASGLESVGLSRCESRRARTAWRNRRSSSTPSTLWLSVDAPSAPGFQSPPSFGEAV